MQDRALSVSELNEYVRRALAGDSMLQNIQLRGEISNFKRHSSGHLYFSLKDDLSRIACVMFRQYAQSLRFVPSDGKRVVLFGSAGLYTASGTYQFYGEAMREDGIGALYEKYLRLKERFQAEGLFDTARKKPLPLLPRAIGIVTSATGAVLHDIQTVAYRRFPGIPLILRPAQVQGEGAAKDIAEGIKELALLPQVDVLIVGRGGGSLEDLWAFNEEMTVRAISDCPKPLISAVGHETDVTLADFAADLRAATPSAAAEMAVPRKDDLLELIAKRFSALSSSVELNINQRLNLLNETELKLSLCDPSFKLKQASAQTTLLRSKLEAACALQTKHAEQKEAVLNSRLMALDPHQTLRRGYTMALHNGKPLISASKVPEIMDIQFADGLVNVKTLSISLERA